MNVQCATSSLSRKETRRLDSNLPVLQARLTYIDVSCALAGCWLITWGVHPING